MFVVVAAVVATVVTAASAKLRELLKSTTRSILLRDFGVVFALQKPGNLFQ